MTVLREKSHSNIGHIIFSSGSQKRSLQRRPLNHNIICGQIKIDSRENYRYFLASK